MTYTVFVKWFDAHRAERLVRMATPLIGVSTLPYSQTKNPLNELVNSRAVD